MIDYPSKGSNQYADLLEIVRGAVADMPAFYVLASSFSGSLAIKLARAEPEKVRGVILSASFLRSPQLRLARFRFAARSGRWNDQDIEKNSDLDAAEQSGPTTSRESRDLVACFFPRPGIACPRDPGRGIARSASKLSSASAMRSLRRR